MKSFYWVEFEKGVILRVQSRQGKAYRNLSRVCCHWNLRSTQIFPGYKVWVLSMFLHQMRWVVTQDTDCALSKHTHYHFAVTAEWSARGQDSWSTRGAVRLVPCNSTQENLSPYLLGSKCRHQLKLKRLISNHLIMKQDVSHLYPLLSHWDSLFLTL